MGYDTLRISNDFIFNDGKNHAMVMIIFKYKYLQS